jgi:hypothetical protein
VTGAALLTGTQAAAQVANGSASAAVPGELRTFTLPRPVQMAPAEQAAERPLPPVNTPNPRESLRTMIGLGYVQGADWGSEVLASGSLRGAQVDLHTLITSGREGLRFDSGALSLFDPRRGWRIEGGDVFSHLRGAARGGRVSWRARGDRRPAIAVYAPGRGARERDTIVTYRDQLRFRGQTLLDAELASDRSHLLRSRLAVAPFELEAVYRARRSGIETREISVAGGITVWQGIIVSGGLFRARLDADRNEWRMVSVRVPIGRAFDVTVERAFSASLGGVQTTSAMMASIAAGGLRFFHRYQTGAYELTYGGFSDTIHRQQIRSMSSYAAGSRLNLTLQLASQFADTGRVEHWEELQATVKLTRGTTLRTVTAVPDVRNRERVQVFLRQDLPGRFAVQADYGRISAYQSIARELDRSRFKLMFFKTVEIATPAGGATVTGRVVDHARRPVAGARVTLGPYSADTDAGGVYRLRHVPRGEYELSLDSSLLPADYAWDGRGERVTINSSAHVGADLGVAPLNSIHGRVYVDRNGNGQFDGGEAVANAVLRLGDRLTSTDAAGAYSFYNLWPGAYTIALQAVPAEFTSATREITVTLLDGGPVTGADFRVAPKDKPILWSPGR